MLNSSAADQSRCENANFVRLVESYRQHGHRIAQINPLHMQAEFDGTEVPELIAKRYNLKDDDAFQPKNVAYWKHFNGSAQVPVSQGLDLLRQTYANHSGFEFMHIENEAEREWFAEQVESSVLDDISSEYKTQLALEIAKCQNFEHFLANKFPTYKRYGGEGCESMIALFMEATRSSQETGVDHLVVGMPHRGRLNLMAGLFQFPPSRIFHKMKGLSELPSDALATGDVLTHLYTSVDLKVEESNVHVSLLPNPSHLEAVNPVAAGKVRAKLKHLKCYDYADSDDQSNPRVLCIQVHGDGAITGQGINQETIGFSCVPHFRTGGSIHLIVNNQLGFTTPQERGRSSRYPSDVGKMVCAPVIHVNADFPEDIVKATRIAIAYRQQFHKDVFIDLMCFRRWGHNEVDDPTFTNPVIYKLIHGRKSIPDQYCERLVEQGLLSPTLLKDTVESHTALLTEELTKADTLVPPHFYLGKQWSGIQQSGHVITEWDTGLDVSLLKYIGAKSVDIPGTFNIHKHLSKTFVNARLNRITDGESLDWATAEALAIGSLLYQGHDVRLSGEDVGRGTFSQRHAMLVDQNSGEMLIPLNSLVDHQGGKLEIASSTLSEEAVLGFEYGFSLEHPDNLVIWEAQFGDFFNGAQIIIDTMITSGETKWMLHSGMVMLLPHGMDGTGPEHSSCRLERFLQGTDSNEEGRVDGDYNNVQVVNPTTPAQYFHLLRRQLIRNFRKPLIVIAPKTLLRLSAATSSLLDMSPGTTFQPVLDDSTTNPKLVKKLIFVSGKHFYTLNDKRVELKLDDVAIIRLESLCPFPVQQLQSVLKTYENATEIIWSQEEHQNMGAWTFIKPRFENFLGRQIKYKGRGPLGAPATGIGGVHRAEK
ncbi:putative 2-oxoglutarate dehydrogenase E1 component DHKTD1, mitochondrial [Orchesella cincta]|uniref:Putative 2-oxoglutarate dehydrogenase E1 component DHKTD1, mitochondrial n=1 Tax=Orchesella cincta TaxID=48709 RepID=A0A1D2N397_ORCCI|nr:putative 2-oxoglutarate dehydrogenase E1 component DHKTD1, mitochondrial [Orchesella cincta]